MVPRPWSFNTLVLQLDPFATSSASIASRENVVDVNDLSYVLFRLGKPC